MQITRLGWRAMFNHLRSTNQLMLEELDMSWSNTIDDVGAQFLADMIANTTSLKSLYVSFNDDIRDSASWQALSQHASRLTRLDLARAYIDDEGMGILANSLQSYANVLKILDLTRVLIVTEAGWQRFLPVLGNANCVVEELTLCGNYIQDESMTIFGNALARNTSLKILYICDMQGTTSGGWRNFVNCLQGTNCVIEELELSGNEDGIESDDVLSAVANILCTNTKLKDLCLGHEIEYTESGLAAFSDSLCNTTSILDLYNSNHTLETLDEGGIGAHPRELRPFLRMNKCTNKDEVARLKILRYYLLADGAFKIEEFAGMDLAVLPLVVDWMGRDQRGHSALFCLLRSLPYILGSVGHGNGTLGSKRNREE